MKGQCRRLRALARANSATSGVSSLPRRRAASAVARKRTQSTARASRVAARSPAVVAQDAVVCRNPGWRKREAPSSVVVGHSACMSIAGRATMVPRCVRRHAVLGTVDGGLDQLPPARGHRRPPRGNPRAPRANPCIVRVADQAGDVHAAGREVDDEPDDVAERIPAWRRGSWSRHL